MLRRQYNYPMAGVLGIGGVIIFCIVLAIIGAASSTRVETITENERIPYEVEYIEDDSLDYGKTSIRSSGTEGTRAVTYKVTFKGDKEVAKEYVGSKVVMKPINKVVAKGTKPVWRCHDTTSFDQNPYNDNYCEYSDGTGRYVPDSEARKLDPDYTPGQYGAAYYNNF